MTVELLVLLLRLGFGLVLVILGIRALWAAEKQREQKYPPGTMELAGIAGLGFAGLILFMKS